MFRIYILLLAYNFAGFSSSLDDGECRKTAYFFCRHMQRESQGIEPLHCPLTMTMALRKA